MILEKVDKKMKNIKYCRDDEYDEKDYKLEKKIKIL